MKNKYDLKVDLTNLKNEKYVQYKIKKHFFYTEKIAIVFVLALKKVIFFFLIFKMILIT
jgi:hypothetical protein